MQFLIDVSATESVGDMFGVADPRVDEILESMNKLLEEYRKNDDTWPILLHKAFTRIPHNDNELLLICYFMGQKQGQKKAEQEIAEKLKQLSKSQSSVIDKLKALLED